MVKQTMPSRAKRLSSYQGDAPVPRYSNKPPAIQTITGSPADPRVVETIAALNQFFQPLGEAYCRSAIDRLVIKADRQAQIFADGDVPVNDPRLLTNAAHRHPEGMGGERNSPSSPFPKHPHCCDAHRPPH